MTDSGTMFAPASTIITASRVPATTRSRSLSASCEVVGFVTNAPLMRPTRTAPTGPMERDVADRQGGGGAVEGEDVGVVLLVRREDGQDDLHVVVVALREERPDRPVGEAHGEDRRLGRARLALDEAAGDLPGGVHALLVVDREREEVGALARLLRGDRGGEDDAVPVSDENGPVGLLGELARLEREGLVADRRLNLG